jgi:hypothetical protein
MATSLDTERTQFLNGSLRTQREFLEKGGLYRMADVIVNPVQYVHQEYPKLLSFSQGWEDIERETENVRGRLLTWTERREKFDSVVVETAEEEAAAIAKRGGKLPGSRPDGDETDADNEGSLAAIQAEQAVLKAKLAVMKENADLRRQIAAAAAEEAAEAAPAPVTLAPVGTISPPAEDPEMLDEYRSALRGFGVKVDLNWNLERLEAEHDKASAAQSKKK